MLYQHNHSHLDPLPVYGRIPHNKLNVLLWQHQLLYGDAPHRLLVLNIGSFNSVLSCNGGLEVLKLRTETIWATEHETVSDKLFTWILPGKRFLVFLLL